MNSMSKWPPLLRLATTKKQHEKTFCFPRTALQFFKHPTYRIPLLERKQRLLVAPQDVS